MSGSDRKNFKADSVGVQLNELKKPGISLTNSGRQIKRRENNEGICIHDLTGCYHTCKLKNIYSNKKLVRNLSFYGLVESQDITKEKKEIQNEIDEIRDAERDFYCKVGDPRKHWCEWMHCSVAYFPMRCQFIKVPSQFGRWLWYRYIADCKPADMYIRQYSQAFNKKINYHRTNKTKLEYFALLDYGISLKWLDYSTRNKILIDLGDLFSFQDKLKIAAFENASLSAEEVVRLLMSMSLCVGQCLEELYLWMVFDKGVCPLIGYFPTYEEYAPYLKKPKKEKQLQQIEIKESKQKLSVINLTFPLKVEKKTNYQTKRARLFPHKPEKCLVEAKEQAEMAVTFNVPLKDTDVHLEDTNLEITEHSKQTVTPKSVSSDEDVVILFKQEEEHEYNEDEFTDEEGFDIEEGSEMEEIPTEAVQQRRDSKSSMEFWITSLIISEMENSIQKYSDSNVKIPDNEEISNKLSANIEKTEDEKKISDTELSVKSKDDTHGKQNELSTTSSQGETIQIVEGHESFESEQDKVIQIEEGHTPLGSAHELEEENKIQIVEAHTSFESAHESEEKMIQIVEPRTSFESEQEKVIQIEEGHASLGSAHESEQEKVIQIEEGHTSLGSAHESEQEKVIQIEERHTLGSAHESEEDNVIQIVEGQPSLESSHENEKKENVLEINESDQTNPIEITPEYPQSHEQKSKENTKDLTALYKKSETAEPETSSSESGVYITETVDSQPITSSSKSETMKTNPQPEIKESIEIISENDMISKETQHEILKEIETPTTKKLDDETDHIYSEETFENNLTKEFIKRKHLESLYFPLKHENRCYFKDDPIGMLKSCYKYMIGHRFSKYSIFSLRMLYRISLAGFTNLTKLCINFGYIADDTGDTLLSIGAIREGKLRDLVLLCPRDEMPSFNPEKFTDKQQHGVPDFAWRKARILCPSLCTHLILLAMPRYNVSSKFMTKNTPLSSFHLSTGYRGVKAHQFRLWYFDLTLKVLCNYSATLVSLSFFIWHSRERLDNLIKKLLSELKNLEKFEYYGTFQYIGTVEDICEYFIQNKTKLSRLAIFKIEDPCSDNKRLAEEMEKRKLKFAPFFEIKGIDFDMGTFWL